MTKMKYLSLLAILPILSAIIVASNIGTSFAGTEKAEGKPGGLSGPQSFGAATAGIVCGDRLCSEITPTAPMPPVMNVLEESMPEFMPSLEFVSVHTFSAASPNTYAVVFKVTSGSANLENIKIFCKTDVDTLETEVSSLTASTTATNMVRIKAMDPASITGEIISFQIQT